MRNCWVVRVQMINNETGKLRQNSYLPANSLEDGRKLQDAIRQVPGRVADLFYRVFTSAGVIQVSPAEIEGLIRNLTNAVDEIFDRDDWEEDYPGVPAKSKAKAAAA